MDFVIICGSRKLCCALATELGLSRSKEKAKPAHMAGPQPQIIRVRILKLFEKKN